MPGSPLKKQGSPKPKDQLAPGQWKAQYLLCPLRKLQFFENKKETSVMCEMGDLQIQTSGQA